MEKNGYVYLVTIRYVTDKYDVLSHVVWDIGILPIELHNIYIFTDVWRRWIEFD